MAKRTGTKVITNEARMSYAHVFEPTTAPGATQAKYSVSILIPKSDKETIKLVRAAIAEAAEEGKAKFNGKVPANLKTPLRDGDEEREDDPVYAGHYFINANSNHKPGLVKKGPAGGMIEITDEDDFYSGCYAKAAINFYAFNTNGNKGVAAGLGNLLKTRDGDRLGGGASAESDFADEFDDNDYDDNDEDLLG